MTQHAHPMASFGTPVGAGNPFTGLLGKLAARRARTLEQSRLRRELDSYSDRQLSDLGISRLDIGAIARGTYRT